MLGQDRGAVALAPNLGYYAFEYDSRFIKSGIELAPLGHATVRRAGNRSFLSTCPS